MWDVITYVRATSNGAAIRLGQWGYTYSQGNGVWISSGSRLGYHAEDAVDLLGRTGDISSNVLHGLTYALVVEL